ncbi:ribonuclease domain-containing protein [Rathayibacter toxicus]|uniref:ribonuclease domain-containing protein n=1 Tax=Rathayibacter toxicus TaxID=145458 RepID=UPI00358EC10E
MPERPTTLLERLDTTGEKFPNIRGGQTYDNRPEEGYMFLPTARSDGSPISYKEYDLYPKVPGQKRGLERLVTGDDGSAYYTSDHYHNFIQIRGEQ